MIYFGIISIGKDGEEYLDEIVSSIPITHLYEGMILPENDIYPTRTVSSIHKEPY